MAENRIMTALEAEKQENLALQAIPVEILEVRQNVQKPADNMVLLDHASLIECSEEKSKIQRLDCIYDDEPLEFEKDPQDSIKRLQDQDPLEEVDLGDGSIKRPTYINAKIDLGLKIQMVELLKEFKDCFAWDYAEMPGLSRNLIEHRLPIRPDKRPIKQ